MSSLLLPLLLLAALTGVIAATHWLKRPEGGSEHRTYVHAFCAGLVLLVLLLGLDQHASGAALRLGGIFFTIATGMLLFLQRQRQKRFSMPLLGLHIGCALLALITAGLWLG